MSEAIRRKAHRGGPAAVLLLATTIACATGADEEGGGDGSWIGTITTEGDVTTVVNESGSVWGGTATLVEELSIGVEAGDEAYMLGRVDGLAATDERIFIIDGSIPTVRVFDSDGHYLHDIGRGGAGPGELRRPSDLKIDPERGRLYVRDYSNNRITVFDPEGGLIETWPLEGGFSTVLPMVLGIDGRLYVQQVVVRGETLAERRIGMVPYGPGGPAGEPIVEPYVAVDAPQLPPVVGTGVRFEGPGPFAPRYLWVMSPDLAIVSGVSDRYRLESRGPSGTTVIERRLEPVALATEEAEWHQRVRTAINRSIDPDWQWGSGSMPTHKPFFEELYADFDGRIWVRRLGPGIHVGDCDENPDPAPAPQIRYCWEDTVIFDVFEPAGRYLGEVELPPRLRFTRKPFISGETVVLAREDEAGTIMVKRYRVVQPGQ